MKTNYLYIRLTEKQKCDIQTAATTKGLTMSAYVVSIIQKDLNQKPRG